MAEVDYSAYFENKDVKRFRRKSRHQGATWTPGTVSALTEDGAWCKQCRQRHGYMKMGFTLEKRASGWYILWSCPKTGDVLEEKVLNNG